MTRVCKVFWCLFTIMLLATPALAQGILFVGTDEEEFDNTLPDRLGKFVTSGAGLGSGVIIPLDYHLNGIANGVGFLYAGDALSNSLRTIDYDGTLLTSISAGFASGCCNEEMVVATGSEIVGTGTLFHAHYSTNIQLIRGGRRYCRRCRACPDAPAPSRVPSGIVRA